MKFFVQAEIKKVKNEDTNSKINFTKERLDYGLELMSQISYIHNEYAYRTDLSAIFSFFDDWKTY